ncbi:dihydrolipoamide acetyltransferase family protein [Rubeoparvulum massiliense]|uniref:dihydrolipoamide acetyltransferase family protein n=1 Tax=Rubeoparvulum massiliense TaxID=1631346 RepID=UPI00065DBF3B|nr:dihydrolipoamide acetyltransferase family protein [Rubeoparvulum massiliense]
MASEVKMPQLGESVTEGTLQKWLVKVGDFVEEYAPLCEVSTDKVNAEVPSTVRGKIVQLVAEEGDTIQVGKVICFIETEDQVKKEEPTASLQPIEPLTKEEITALTTAQTGGGRYSPAVLRLAQEYGIDLAKLLGTGQGGRITRKDVLNYVESNRGEKDKSNNNNTREEGQRSLEQAPIPQIAEPPRSRVEEVAPSTQATLASAHALDTTISVTPVRRTIAQRMVQSKHDAPHAWTMVEVDATNLVQVREHYKAAFYKENGFSLTFLPFFMKAVVEALKKYPILNSQWREDHILQKKEINLSVAIATEEALYVPVIRHADEKSIYGLAKSLHDLADRTRANKLTLEDMQGGTFTVNNTGSFGSVLSMPIINAPQAAIMSIEAIVKRPVVMHDMIAIRSMVNLCLSLDHRVLDGLVCGRFLQEVKQQVESMSIENTTIY